MRFVVVHGVGSHDADFHGAWAPALRSQLDSDVEVVGLRWSDDQDRAAIRFPMVSQRFADAMAELGNNALAELRGDPAWADFHATIYDVFSYSFLHEVRHLLQTLSLKKLLDLTRSDPGNTVVVAHSLGCALAAHLAQLARRVSGRVPWRALVMLAPPLGIASPLGWIPDPLAVTPDSSLPSNIHGGLDAALAGGDTNWVKARDYSRRVEDSDRRLILTQLATNWRVLGRDRLQVVVNRNDPICSDVKVTVAGKVVDLVPFKQGFADDEREILSRLGRFREVSFGAPSLGRFADNHSVLNYLSQPETVAALQEAVR